MHVKACRAPTGRAPSKSIAWQTRALQSDASAQLLEHPCLLSCLSMLTSILRPQEQLGRLISMHIYMCWPASETIKIHLDLDGPEVADVANLIIPILRGYITPYLVCFACTCLASVCPGHMKLCLISSCSRLKMYIAVVLWAVPGQWIFCTLCAVLGTVYTSQQHLAPADLRVPIQDSGTCKCAGGASRSL